MVGVNYELVTSVGYYINYRRLTSVKPVVSMSLAHIIYCICVHFIYSLGAPGIRCEFSVESKPVT